RRSRRPPELHRPPRTGNHEKGIGDGAAGDLTIVRPAAAASRKRAEHGGRRRRHHPDPARPTSSSSVAPTARAPSSTPNRKSRKRNRRRRRRRPHHRAAGGRCVTQEGRARRAAPPPPPRPGEADIIIVGRADRPSSIVHPEPEITKKESATAPPATSPSCGQQPLHHPGGPSRSSRSVGITPPYYSRARDSSEHGRRCQIPQIVQSRALRERSQARHVSA